MSQRTRRPAKILPQILDPLQRPQLNIVYTLVAAVASNAIYEAIKDRWGQVGAVLVFLIVFTILMLVVWLPQHVWPQQGRTINVRGSDTVARRRGLIALVSQRPSIEETAAYAAIMHHLPKLRHVWLLHAAPPAPVMAPLAPAPHAAVPAVAPSPNRGREALPSATLARQLKEHFEGRISGLRVDLLEIRAVHEPREVFHQASVAYAAARQHGIKRNDLITDVTGGTVTMSIGLLLAGQEDDHTFEYLTPNSYKLDGTIDLDKGSQPREIGVRFERPRGWSAD